MRLIILSIFLTLLAVGCTIGSGDAIFPPEADLEAQPSLGKNDDGKDLRVLVANGLSETISLIERTYGIWKTEPNILPTGSSPNQLVVRGNTAYLVNSLSNSIQIIDLDSMTTVREISTGAGTNPMSIEFIDNEKALVTCYISNDVRLIDLGDNVSPENLIVTKIPLPSGDDLPRDDGVLKTYARPGGMAIVDDTCYIACSNLESYHLAGGPGVLVEIDINDLSVGRIHVLSGRDTISVLYSARFPDRLVVVSAGSYTPESGFTGNGAVESLDLPTGEIFQVINVDGAPFNGVIGPDDILYMENGKESKVLRADLHEGVQLEGFQLPTYGGSLSYASAILSCPGLLLVTNFNADRFYIISPDDGEMLAELQTGDGPDALAFF
ncbi:MAG: hypothetical protein ABIC40_05765 [bacterium]